MAALIEPTLTLLVIKTNNNPRAKAIKATFQSTANITPMLGATPLPALNLWNTEYTCPKITLTPARYPVKLPINNIINKVVIKPLRKSKRNTHSPNFQPKTRTALVAPAFPLPSFMMSLPFNLEINIEGEILPTK